MKIGTIIIWNWQNNTRWYNAEIFKDLLGDLLLIQRWGGKTNILYGRKITKISSLKIGLKYLRKINKKRKSKKDAYKLISVKCY